MARKTLLTEAEIRSFMKLANLGPIGDARLNEWTPTIEEEEELPLEDEEELPMPDGMGDMDADMGDMDADMGDVDADMGDMDADMGDMDADMDMGADMAPAAPKEEQFKDLVSQLADLVGIDVEMDDGTEMADTDMEMGDDVEDVDSLEGGDDLGDEAALDAVDAVDDMGLPDEDEEEPPANTAYMEGNTDKVVSEVARRVAARLRALDKKQKMTDQLTERIYARLTKK